MLALPLLSALMGCTTFADSTSIDVSSQLPEMTLDCDEDVDDSEENGTRIYSGNVPMETGCEGHVYTRIEAVSWSDFSDDIPDQANIQWREFFSTVSQLSITNNGEAAIPQGVQVQLEQLVATQSGKYDEYESDPGALLDALGSNRIDGSDEFLLSLDYTFTGLETNLVNDIPVTYNEIGPVETIQESYDNDDTLYVMSVAKVFVPNEHLDQSVPTNIEVDITQELDLVARIKVRLFGGGNKD